MIKELLNHATIYFLTPVKNKIDEDLVIDLQKELPTLKVHSLSIIDLTSSSFGIAYRVLSKIYWHLGRVINNFFPVKHAILDNKFFLNPLAFKSEDLTIKFEKILLEIQPEIVQIDFIDNADLVFFIPPTCKKFLVLHDLRFSTVMQAAAIRGDSKSYINYIGNLVKHQELPYLRFFDYVFVFSEIDKIRLKQEGIDNVLVAPFAVLPNKEITSQALGKKPTRLVFLGPDHHEPNRDALQWFAEQCYHLLYPEFQIPVEVIGNWSLINRKRFEKYPKIQFRGFVPDLQHALRDSIMIVPLRMGSGIRTKILDAFALNIPVITTTVGVDGIPITNKQHCIIADEAEQFVEAIKSIHRNSRMRINLILNAFDLVSNNFSLVNCTKKRLEAFNKM